MIRIAREITRFSSKKEIDDMFKKARRVITKPGVHILISKRTRDFSRVLIITPKAVGSAPVRNILRRQIRSIFYQEQLYTRGFNCIVIFKAGYTPLAFGTLRELLLHACTLQ